MAMTDKETAFRIIEQLPDDASLDEIHDALDSYETKREESASPTPPAASLRGDVSKPVERRPVKKGYITVLEPVRPVPQVSAELVNYIIEKIRREREDRFLGLAGDDE
jgi:hypothetical protein